MEKKVKFQFTPALLYWLGVVATIVITTLEFVHHGAENYIDFRDATLNFFAGISSYTPEYVAAHGRFYLYSPVFHYLFAPFAYLPFYVGGYLWNLFGWSAFWLGIHYLPDKVRKHETALMGYLLLFVMQSIFCFQFNVLVGAIFVLAYDLLERDQPLWAVVLIMVSATCKIYGIIELALLLCYPKFWRNMSLAAVAGVLLFLLPMTKLGLSGYIPWHQQWLEALTTHTATTCEYISVVWAQPIQAWALPHMRWIQSAALVVLAVLFFLQQKQWNKTDFKVGVLAVLMMYIILFSESAEFCTHMISMTGFGIWYFNRKNPSTFERVLLWTLFVLFGVMPIDILCPPSWCLYVHKTLWIGVWVMTVAFVYMTYKTIRHE